MFKKFEINTCKRKIHFIGQIYLETISFQYTYESRKTVPSNYKGGVDFQGRGMKQITHDYNYLAYYDYVNGTNLFKDVYMKYRSGYESVGETVINRKKASENGLTELFYEDLKTYAKKISTDLFHAFNSAGWFSTIYKSATVDAMDEGLADSNVKKVTIAINGGENNLTERQNYTKWTKEFFKIRRKLHRQIIFILLIFFSNSYTAQEKPSSVFEKSKIIGEISKNTSYECSECYLFKLIQVYNKIIHIKIPVSTVEHQKNRLIFRADYEVSLKNNSKNIIEVASTYTAQRFKLFIAKDKNDLYVNKIEEFSNASYKYKIASDDFVDIPATLICQDILKNKKIVTEYFDVMHFLKNNTINKDCFHCPVQYSTDECLKMKADSTPFLWIQ